MPHPRRPLSTRDRTAAATLALAWSLATALGSGTTARAAQAPGDAEPRIPGAITAQPNWLADAPFDLKKFFAMPPAAENAAPLYLEALAEFSGEADECLPPGRRGGGAARSKRWASTIESWQKDTTAVPTRQVDTLLADYYEGFRKLDLAQARPRCVFALGVDEESPLPHAQAIRQAARILQVRVGRSLDRDDCGAAVADLGRLLRLARDVRPRGVALTSLASAAVDALALDQVLPTILAARKLKPEHCDRLLRLLADHEAQGPDLFAAGVMGEYVMGRAQLHWLTDGSKTVAGPDGRPEEKPLDRPAQAREFVAQLTHAGGKEPTPADLADPSARKQAEEALELAGREAGPARAALDEFVRTMLAAPPGYRARSAAVARFRTAYPPGSLPTRLRLLDDAGGALVPVAARDAANLNAARCLVALRRWQMLQGKPPTDLAEACRAAKLGAVPADPFADGPLKLATVGGDLAVYSVGPDGTDDGGQLDNERGRQQRGDFIYRLPRRK